MILLRNRELSSECKRETHQMKLEELMSSSAKLLRLLLKTVGDSTLVSRAVGAIYRLRMFLISVWRFANG